jgi:hypothetical protein
MKDGATTKVYLVNKQSNEIAGLPCTYEPVAQTMSIQGDLDAILIGGRS